MLLKLEMLHSTWAQVFMVQSCELIILNGLFIILRRLRGTDIVTYPSMMYNLAGSIACSPMMEIFRQFALHHRLAFQAMLAISSKHRANMNGKIESVQSLTHKMRTLRLMNRYIREETTAQNDGTIYAVASMAVIEVPLYSLCRFSS